MLFNETIFYNISYGRPGASAEEVYEAARRVRICHLIGVLHVFYDLGRVLRYQ